MAARLKVTGVDRAMLESWLRAPTLAQGLALRAKVILASADGEGVRPMARRLRVSANTVAVWRRRYRSEGLSGLRTKARAGRPRRITSAKEQAVISATLRKPKAATHWSTRRLAKEVRLSPATVHRIWQKYGLQPHRVESFKFSRDPRVRREAGRYRLALSGPTGAGPGAVDESPRFRRLIARNRRCRCGPDCPLV
jgi:transposase